MLNFPFYETIKRPLVALVRRWNARDQGQSSGPFAKPTPGTLPRGRAPGDQRTPSGLGGRYHQARDWPVPAALA
jgi:hypothetical protein